MTNFPTVTNFGHSTQGLSPDEMQRMALEEEAKKLSLLNAAQLKEFASHTESTEASRAPSQPPTPRVTENNTYDSNHNLIMVSQMQDGIEIKRENYNGQGTLISEVRTTTEYVEGHYFPKSSTTYDYTKGGIITEIMIYDHGLPAGKKEYSYLAESSGNYAFSDGVYKQVTEYICRH